MEKEMCFDLRTICDHFSTVKEASGAFSMTTSSLAIEVMALTQAFMWL
jgi:hypothetical protein